MAQRPRASAEDWARVAVKTLEVIMDAVFRPPLLTLFGGAPEAEPQPATFRVLEPKALPAPKEVSR